MYREDEGITKQLLAFLFSVEQWKNENYQKEFNINGKNDHTLTDRQFQILYFIHTEKCKTLSELEGLIRLSGSSLSITISKMVKENLIAKSSPAEGDDGRKTYLALTQYGLEQLDDTFERILNSFDTFHENLDQTARMDLKYCMDKIMHIL